MATFTYKRLAGRGPGAPRAGVGTVEAPDRASAIREIVRRGETPANLEEVTLGRNGSARGHANGHAPALVNGSAGHGHDAGAGGAPAGGLGAWRSRRVMSRGEMAQFVRELATAINAGLPLVQSLRTIARQGRAGPQRAMLTRIIEQVEHGKSLADAAAGWGKPFGDLTINMMRAGEASGRLGEVLMQAADLQDRDVKLRRSVLGATLYPAILGVLIVVAIIVVVTVIVPRVLKSIGGQIRTLPLPTQIVQGVASFFGGYWWLIIPGVVVAVYLMVRTYRTPEARMWIDRKLLTLPIVGRLLRDVAVARFTRTLGTLTSAGLPVLQALKITKGTLGNRAMEAVVDEVCDQVAAGRTIAEPMEQSGYFPPMLVQIVNLGERSGRLDEMLNQAAGAFEDRTEMSVKLFTTALPPILVVMLACAVGFIVLAIMLPMLQLQESLGR